MKVIEGRGKMREKKSYCKHQGSLRKKKNKFDIFVIYTRFIQCYTNRVKNKSVITNFSKGKQNCNKFFLSPLRRKKYM